MAKQVTVSVKGDSKQYQDSLKDADKANKSFSDSVDKVQKASAVAFAATTAVIGATVAKFAEFESAFGELTSRFVKDAELQVDALETIKNGVFDTSVTYGIAVENITEETLKLIDAGIGVEDSLRLVDEAAKINIATGQDLSAINNLIAQSYLLYGDQVDDVTQITDVFFALQQDGVSSLEDLSTVIDKTLIAGNKMGTTFEETTAIMAVLQNTSGQAAKGFGAFADLLITGQDDIADASDEAAQALSKQSIEQNGLIESIRMAESALNDQEASLTDFIQTGAASATLLALLKVNQDELDETIRRVSDSTQIQADLEATLAARLEETSAKTARATAAFDRVFILLGEQLAPTVNKMTDFLIDLAEAMADPEFIEYSATILQIVAAVTGLTLAITTGIKTVALFKVAIAAASTVVTIATGAVGALRIAVVALTGPIGIAVTAITALVGAFAFWKSGSDDAKESTDDLTESIASQGEVIKDSVDIVDDANQAKTASDEARLEAKREFAAEEIAIEQEKLEELEEIEQEDLERRIEDEELERERKREEKQLEREEELERLQEHKEAEREIQTEAIEREAQLEAARRDGLSQAELAFLQRQNALDIQFKQLALKEDDDHAKAQRNLLLEKQETLDADRRAFQEQETEETTSFLKALLGLETTTNEARVLSNKETNAQIGQDARSASSSLFGSNKNFQVATITGDTAVAVTKALASAPPPANATLAASAAAKGGAQLAVAKGLAFQNGGIVPGGTTFDSVNALLRPGEFVAPPQDAQAAALGVARGRGMIEEQSKDINFNITVEGSIIGGDEQQLAEGLAEIIIPEIRNQQEFNNAESLF
jgi:TP901 family phage tail tape measure protein